MNLLRSQTGRRVCAAFGAVLLISGATTTVSLFALDRMRQDTAQLVNRQLARQQAASELLGELRLNGAQANALANSDSQEFSDLLHPQLAASDTRLLNAEARLAATAPADAADDAASLPASRAGYQRSRAEVLHHKELGQTQQALERAERAMQPAFTRYAAQVATLLRAQSQRASEVAAQGEARYNSIRLSLAALGLLSLAVSLFMAWRLTVRVVQPLRAALDYAQAVSGGDLSRSFDVRGDDEIAQLLRALSHTVDDLAHTVERVRAGALQVDGKARQLVEGNAAIARRTEHHAGAVQQTAASAEQLSASATENNNRAQDAQLLVSTASSTAAQANAAIASMQSAMERIHAASRQVVDIVSVMDEIAFQTNLLALNAGVEAARAGHQGRGFAVVAGEVRSLAGRASAAAAQIKQLIHQSAREADAGRQAAAGAVHRIVAVDRTVRQVSSLMQEISRASAEQQAGIGAIHHAVAEIDQVMQKNAVQVNHAAEAANDMQQQAHHLAHLVGDFRLAPRVRAS